MYIEKIAYHLDRRDEVPNQELAALLAEKKDQTGIDEIASYLKDKNKSVASDCLKVLYEIGYLEPSLIAGYLDQFIELLKSKNNRMVWGAMIAIANIAKIKPNDVYQHYALIKNKLENGTVITHVWGVYTLINLADHGYYENIIPELFELQKACRPVDFAKRAESIFTILKDEDKGTFKNILEDRLPNLSSAQQSRTKKIISKL